ncbi:hypothetical protein EDB80DRAFT_34331 [Ilyonectria destructans]|nr:hypothetical protein EDB80DRAFT_34331 [Ilyonectria destructans]
MILYAVRPSLRRCGAILQQAKSRFRQMRVLSAICDGSLGDYRGLFTSCLGAQQTICDCINISAPIRYLGLCACIGWWLLFQQTPDENPHKRRWNSHHNFPRRANVHEVQIVMTAKWVFQCSPRRCNSVLGKNRMDRQKEFSNAGLMGPLRWLVGPGLFSATNCWPVLFVCWIDR